MVASTWLLEGMGLGLLRLGTLVPAVAANFADAQTWKLDTW
eukprot:COSAG05_NODE_1249_length_5388_cov_42.102477_4_plen_41_part_00